MINVSLSLSLSLSDNPRHIYLGGLNGREEIVLPAFHKYRPNILESFAYVSKYTPDIIKASKNFMLDSGAFTVLAKGTADSSMKYWENYCNKYIDYIKQYNIKGYIELDLDPIIGYDNVLILRKKLEKEIGYPPIPVWHTSRGIADYKQMCKDYDYVAIGGFVTGEISRTNYPAIRRLIDIAHESDAKIHGLGYTSMEGLKKLPWDSVDSSNWTYCNRFKFFWKFNGSIIKNIKIPRDYKIKDVREYALYNFIEWCKFSEYMETYRII